MTTTTTTDHAWPPVGLGAAIRLPGMPIQHVDQIDARGCATAEAHLLRTIAPLASRLRVRLVDGIPPAPLDTDQYPGAGDQQAVGELHQLVALVRAVRAQQAILRQREAEQRQHQQYRRDAARQRLLAEARPTLEKIASDLAGLDDDVEFIARFMRAVQRVTSADELIRFGSRLRETAAAAGAKKLPPIPSLPPQFDPLPAQRLAKLIGVLPIRISPAMRTMESDGRGAIERDEG